VKIGISCYPTYGGSGAVATELGLALAERGHEVHFVSYAQPFRLTGFQERVFYHAVEMEDYPLFEHPPYSLALAVAVHDAALKYDLDLVHVHYAIPHATSALLAQQMLERSKAPRVVTTLHGTDITLVGQHPSFRAITRWSIVQSDGVTAVSDYLKQRTVEDFGVHPSRIKVIPNFIDTQLFRRDREPCYRSTLAEPGEKILMHISNFRPVKRVEDVVSVFARVSRKIPARLVMVGDGPERPRALLRAEEEGVTDRVLFLGAHHSVHDLLRCADVFLLPSQNESFGLAALEAMACGTPVVASDEGGLPEVVPHGEAGYLLPMGDVDGMAERALAILQDDLKWERMSKGARRVAQLRFDAEKIVPEYEKYYRMVLSGEQRL
jgi:N-acetyl-alpha-D-glucosaminyl L-malate synthase BshA